MSNLIPAQQMGLEVNEAGVVASVSREIEEVRALMTMAMHNPRDEEKALQKVLRACSRKSFAKIATYSFPRGGGTVSGPSVKLARELARAWGRLRFGFRIVARDDHYCHLKGYCVDCESINFVELEDKFPLKIYRKATGWKTTQDEKELRELFNRRGAILVRNAILQMIPSDILEEALEACRVTEINQATAELNKGKRMVSINGLLKTVEKLGISRDDIEKYLGHAIDAMNGEQFAEIRRIARTISHGQATKEEFFPEPITVHEGATISGAPNVNQLKTSYCYDLDGLGEALEETEVRDELIQATIDQLKESGAKLIEGSIYESPVEIKDLRQFETTR